MTLQSHFRYAAAMNRIEISRCLPAELQAAFKCLHAGLSADQQPMLVQTLDQIATSDAEAFSGLLVATAHGKLIAATWVQFTPGSAAVVWPPARDSPAAGDLMMAVANLLDEREIALAQILFATTDPIDEEFLAAAGFTRLVDLAYLTLERSNFPNPHETSLEFVPCADEHPKRLAAMIERQLSGNARLPGA